MDADAQEVAVCGGNFHEAAGVGVGDTQHAAEASRENLRYAGSRQMKPRHRGTPGSVGAASSQPFAAGTWGVRRRKGRAGRYRGAGSGHEVIRREVDHGCTPGGCERFLL
jgi:hypothetical protein